MTTQATGGSPEHLLQDQSRELSRWLSERLGARQCVRDACAAILARQQPLDADIAKILHDNLWDLYIEDGAQPADHFPDTGKMVAQPAA